MGNRIADGTFFGPVVQAGTFSGHLPYHYRDERQPLDPPALRLWICPASSSWHWGVAPEVLAVHQVAFARAHRHFVWRRGWLFAVVDLGAWAYLQGGVLATAAVCTVGALVTISVLGQWYMATSWRFQSMRDLEMGPFDPSRWKRPW